MKKILWASAALAAAAIPALAADLPRRNAPPAPRALPILATWQGFYVGLNAGYTFSGDRSTTIVGDVTGGGLAISGGQIPRSLGSNRGGFLGGAQIGYNLQLSPVIVAGVEADIAIIADNRKTASFAGVGGTVTTVSRSQDWIGTARARLGFLATPEFMIYGTGGLAVGNVKSRLSVASPVAAINFGSGTSNETKAGWTAGAGGEYMFTPNWTLKGEYLYYDLGSERVTRATPLASVSSKTEFNGHIVRAGLNYKF